MHALLNKYKWLKYVIGGFIVSLGILIIILTCTKMSQLQNVINIVIGVSLIIFGVIFMCGSLFSETHKPITPSLIAGSIFVAAGISVIIARFHLGMSLPIELIVYFISILILAFGAFCLFKAISLIYYKEKPLWITLLFFIATVGIVLGILGLCFVPKLVTIAYIILGIALIVVGIIYITLSAVKNKTAE